MGRRCPPRAFLEIDHRNARALGGTDDAGNLAVACRRHNDLMAERDFRREHVETKKADKGPANSANERRSTPAREPIDDTALRALTGLGFKEREARRALVVVAEHFRETTSPIEMVLREALAVLT